MSETADVTRSDDVPIIPKSRVDDGIKLYTTLMHRPPKPEEDPTQEQLSVLEELLLSDTCYVDMGLWGPPWQPHPEGNEIRRPGSDA